MKAKKIAFFIMLSNLFYFPSSTPSVFSSVVRGSFKKVGPKNTNTESKYLKFYIILL